MTNEIWPKTSKIANQNWPKSSPILIICQTHNLQNQKNNPCYVIKTSPNPLENCGLGTACFPFCSTSLTWIQPTVLSFKANVLNAGMQWALACSVECSMHLNKGSSVCLTCRSVFVWAPLKNTEYSSRWTFEASLAYRRAEAGSVCSFNVCGNSKCTCLF